MKTVFSRPANHLANVQRNINAPTGKNNSYVLLIAFGLNYSFKKIHKRTTKLRFNLHYHKALSINLTNLPILVKVFKRRIAFYGDTKLIHTILNFICTFKEKQAYTGKALYKKESRYRIKLMPRDLKDKRK